MILRRVARPLLGTIFVWGGINALKHPEQHAKTAEPVLDAMGEQDHQEMVKWDAMVKIGAGLAFAAGVFPRLTALVLTGSLVPTTLAGHRFWEIEDPQERAAQQAHFMKNLGLAGGLLLAAADTHGKPSLRWRAGRAARDLGDSVASAQKSAKRAAHELGETVAAAPKKAKELLPG
jgi:putative oxidoreductase